MNGYHAFRATIPRRADGRQFPGIRPSYGAAADANVRTLVKWARADAEPEDAIVCLAGTAVSAPPLEWVRT